MVPRFWDGFPAAVPQTSVVDQTLKSGRSWTKKKKWAELNVLYKSDITRLEIEKALNLQQHEEYFFQSQKTIWRISWSVEAASRQQIREIRVSRRQLKSFGISGQSYSLAQSSDEINSARQHQRLIQQTGLMAVLCISNSVSAKGVKTASEGA
jgi:hypothetical protein